MSNVLCRGTHQKLHRQLLTHAHCTRSLSSSAVLSAAPRGHVPAKAAPTNHAPRNAAPAKAAPTNAAPRGPEAAKAAPTTATSEAADTPVADKPLPQYALPRDKMRALVELYHQSADFITHENLDKRIDEAFTGSGSKLFASERAYAHLQQDLRVRRAQPEYVRQSSTGGLSGTGGGALTGIGVGMGTGSKDTETEWSDRMQVPLRLRRVRAALWGTLPDGRPGLEIVEEEAGDIDRTMPVSDALYGTRP